MVHLYRSTHPLPPCPSPSRRRPPSPLPLDPPNPVMRLAEHLRCLALGARDICLAGENPKCSVPALRECEGLWSAMHEMSTPSPPCFSPAPLPHPSPSLPRPSPPLPYPPSPIPSFIPSSPSSQLPLPFLPPTPPLSSPPAPEYLCSLTCTL